MLNLSHISNGMIDIELLLIAGTTVDHLKTQGTCFEILKIKAALWTFIDKIDVEPTNNIAKCYEKL
jgi:hypothetical protein